MRDKKSAIFHLDILSLGSEGVYAAHFAYDELFLFIIWQASTKMAAAAAAVIHNAVAFWGERKSFHYFPKLNFNE